VAPLEARALCVNRPMSTGQDLRMDVLRDQLLPW
jgi:hypothetical protein